ncbi:MAG: hypothetical protein JST04_13240 [Bdellovibrionales bacterium]|nr:hypothetical protein [Bdellovibrionales bacterium]
MRTITEFFGMNLKSAAEKIPALADEATKAAQEAMKAEGKTDEEITAGLPTAAKAALDAKIGETFKLEGEKLAMFAAALEVMKDARGTVKRILVQAKAKDDETPPSGAKEIDGKFYIVEGFPEAQKAPAREERGGKFGGKGGKGGRGDKRGGRGGDRGGRPPRGAAGEGSSEGRAPRAPRAPVEPYKGPNRIALKGSAPASGGETPTT